MPRSNTQATSLCGYKRARHALTGGTVMFLWYHISLLGVDTGNSCTSPATPFLYSLIRIYIIYYIILNIVRLNIFEHDQKEVQPNVILYNIYPLCVILSCTINYNIIRVYSKWHGICMVHSILYWPWLRLKKGTN